MSRYDIALNKEPKKVPPPPDEKSFSEDIEPFHFEKAEVIPERPPIDIDEYVPPPTPASIRERRVWQRYLYFTNPSIASFIDLLVSRVGSIEITRPQHMDQRIVLGAAHEFFMFGNAFIWRTDMSSNGIRGYSYSLLNPDYVNIIRQPMGSNHPFVYEYIEGPRHRYSLQLSNIYHVANRASLYDPLGISIIRGDPQNPVVFDDGIGRINYHMYRFADAWDREFGVVRR